MDGKSSSFPYYNPHVPCYLAWLPLVLLPYVFLWVYGKFLLPFWYSNSILGCERRSSFIQCDYTDQMDPKSTILAEMGRRVCVLYYYVEFLHYWLHVSILFLTISIKTFDRLVRPTYVRVWQSIYFCHHIFWISLWASMTLIATQLPKEDKKLKSSWKFKETKLKTMPKKTRVLVQKFTCRKIHFVKCQSHRPIYHAQ